MPAAKKLSIEEQTKLFDAMRNRHEKLRAAITAYCHRNGGYLISLPTDKVLRLEVPGASELPDKLFDLGYDLRSAGSNTRIIGDRLVPVRVYTFQISPGK
jgi:hypothetical protein